MKEQDQMKKTIETKPGRAKPNWERAVVLGMGIPAVLGLVYTLETHDPETVYSAAAEMIPYSKSRVITQNADGSRLLGEYAVGLNPVISVQFLKEAGNVCKDEVMEVNFAQNTIDFYSYADDCKTLVKDKTEPFPYKEDGSDLNQFIKDAREQFCMLYRQMNDVAMTRIATHGSHYADLSEFVYKPYIEGYCPPTEMDGYDTFYP